MRNAPTLAIQGLSRREHGFSLIEVMIAMTLGLLTIAGIGFVYLGSAQAYKTQDAASRLQEGARYAFELIGKDLRMAGNVGCAPATKYSALNTLAWYGNLFSQPLSSEEQDGTADTATEYSDALQILRADTSTEYIVQSHAPGTSQFTLKAASDIPVGQLLVATDCVHAALFQASAASGVTVSHTNAGTPGNANGLLNSPAAYGYSDGARLYRLQAAQYFVKMNPAGVPALYRTVPVAPNATLTEEELIEGVEDFQVTYSVDTSDPADSLPDFINPNPYLTATQLLAGTTVPGAIPSEKWGRVVSVRISLLMRTAENNVAPQAQTYTFNGATVTATDRYIRKVFTHVIKLRNR